VSSFRNNPSGLDLPVDRISPKSLHNKDQDALFLLNLLQLINPLHVSNTVTIHHEEAVIVRMYMQHDRVSSQSTQMHGKYHMLHIQ
jgi:hypothetical protein